MALAHWLLPGSLGRKAGPAPPALGKFHEKVAIVTGGAHGIGEAICRRLAKEGASVVVADIDGPGALSVVAKIKADGGEACRYQLDISVEGRVAAMVQFVLTRYGRLDILVNNAARFVFGEVTEVSSEDWDTVLAVNVKGYALCTKHALLAMIAGPVVLPGSDSGPAPPPGAANGAGATTANGGPPAAEPQQNGSSGAGSAGKGGCAIVNVASISALVGQPAIVPYAATKAAVLQMTRNTALDCGKHGIRVNVVCPGPIMTEATQRHADAHGKPLEEICREMTDRLILKRMGTVEEVAAAVAFLASDEASFMTGSALMVDGGHTAA